MLIKPQISDETIVSCVRGAYGLDIESIAFLPLGADFNTAVYRMVTKNAKQYFLKLRLSDFNPSSVLIPKYLADQGIKQIVAPVLTQTGLLWVKTESFTTILYPYIDGQNGIDSKLSEEQWMEFGSVVKQLHTKTFPGSIVLGVLQETFALPQIQIVLQYLEGMNSQALTDSIVVQTAFFLQSKKEEILKIINRITQLQSILQAKSKNFVLCHADLHGWNLLIDHNNHLYLIDWDTLILAPKERDLMFIGAGIWNSGYTAREENLFFYQGYGQVDINCDAIAYYRYGRILQDIAEYCEHIFSSNVSEDKKQSFEYLKANFLPDKTVQRAFQIDAQK